MLSLALDYLRLEILLFSWVNYSFKKSIVALFNLTIFKHLLNMLCLFLQLLVLLCHLPHSLLHLVPLSKLVLNVFLFLQCVFLVLQNLCLAASSFGRGLHHMATNAILHYILKSLLKMLVDSPDTLVEALNAAYTSGSISIPRFYSSKIFFERSWIFSFTHFLNGSPTIV
jgi:hypothetical protein